MAWRLQRLVGSIVKQDYSNKHRIPICSFQLHSSGDRAAKTAEAAQISEIDDFSSFQHQNQHQNQAQQRSDELRPRNGEFIFSKMTTAELLRTLITMRIISVGPLFNLGVKFLKSPLLHNQMVKRPVDWCIKNTIYSHFCAGETTAEAAKTLERLWELKLHSILDYGLEEASNNEDCDDNLQHFLDTIHKTRTLPQQSVSYACVKITAITPVRLLEKMSLLLRWKHRHPSSIDLPWYKPSLPLFSAESATFHAQVEPEALTSSEQNDLKLAQERLCRLCRACEEENLPLLVDAEFSSVQPAIDYITYATAEEFNKRQEQPLVYGTIQAYLKDSFSRLQAVVDEADKRGISFGVKLVRGAYLTRENALAKSLGVPSPVHPSIDLTHSCYNRCAAFMLEQVSSGRGSIVLATHNFDSGKAAVRKAEELGICRGDPRLHFAQLKGMADGLSLSLVEAGFRVSKYLPFGPVSQMVMYLIRRAEENRGILGNSEEDQRWIRKELMRRWLKV